MQVNTASGSFNVNKRSWYAKAALGYQTTGAWDGAATFSVAMNRARELFLMGVPARQAGVIAGQEYVRSGTIALRVRPENRPKGRGNSYAARQDAIARVQACKA